MDRGWPAKEVKPRRQDGGDGIRREGPKHGVKRVTTPVVHANKKMFPPKENRSRRTCCMGKPRCVDGRDVTIGAKGCEGSR